MATNYLPVGCFGKLPCYGDFLEGKNFQPTSKALKDWVFAGRESVGQGDGDPDTEETRKVKETIGRRFLCGLPGSVELVAGVVRPSTDQGGRRDFPFMVFAHFPRRWYRRNYALLPMALSPVWDALDDAWDNLTNVVTKGAFEEVLASTFIPGPAPVSEVRNAYRNQQQEVADRIFDQETAHLDSLLENMPELVGKLRKRGSENGVRLELPISDGGATGCFDAAFWIDLLNHQFRWRSLEPMVFMEEPAEKKRCGVGLIFGILAASDYSYVMGCEGSGPTVTRPAKPSEPRTQPTPSTDKNLTYADLLARRFLAKA